MSTSLRNIAKASQTNVTLNKPKKTYLFEGYKIDSFRGKLPTI